MDKHREKLRTGTTKLYQHFQSRGHNESDFHFYGIELVKGDIITLRIREKMWIDKFQVI